MATVVILDSLQKEWEIKAKTETSEATGIILPVRDQK